MNAIGTAQPKATPSQACGAGKNRLKSGYETISAAATNARRTVVASSSSTSPNAQSISTANSTSASCGDTRRDASGRSRVRCTNGSMSRSSRSLMMQPAERVSTVPSTKTPSSRPEGRPPAAIQSAQSVGQSSSRMPIGRSSRISSACFITSAKLPA